MSLTQKYFSSHGHSSPSSKKTTKPFDETIIFRLKSLPQIPSSPSIPVAWLIQAVNLLSATLSSAAALLSDPSLAGADAAAISAHLDSSDALLDAANAISAELDRLSSLRLHLRLALHLTPGAPDSRDILLLSCSPKPSSPRFADLRKLPPPAPPRGNISAIRRVIYAVEAVSALVIGSLVSALGSKPGSAIRVPEHFPWAEAFNKVSTAVSKRAGVIEIDAVESAVKELVKSIENEDEEEVKKAAVVGVETKVEALADGLDLVGTAVDGLFRAALRARNAALQSFRAGLGPKKCK